MAKKVKMERELTPPDQGGVVENLPGLRKVTVDTEAGVFSMRRTFSAEGIPQGRCNTIDWNKGTERSTKQ